MAVIRAILAVAALTAMPVLYGLLAGIGQPTINAAVYPALRAIENACRAEERATVACQTVLQKMKACDAETERCRIQDYYCAASEAGFDLPTLYLGDRELRC